MESNIESGFVEDTIVAISTAPGRGGIGIVRLSGARAMEIARGLVRLTATLEHGRARFARVVDADGGVMDEAVVTAFVGPNSYTGEDLVEIAAHGSPVVLRAVVDGALSLGARVAAPGEFTRRAFLSGRLDLTQAEAVGDLIAAQTLDQARVAAQQMGGAMSRRVMPAKGALLHLIALLEAGMDFASGELDDVDVVSAEQIAREIEEVSAPLRELAGSFRRGLLMREGASLALVGRPNVGKSSLFNRLLERERAIVTAVPGTTRDTVEESVAIGGVPVRLIDTAGLRAGGDEAEKLGMARSREALADADLVLVVVDNEEPVEVEGLEGRPVLVVRNKVDLWGERGARVGQRGEREEVWTSAVTGEGISELREAILRELKAEGGVAEAGALNTLRQREAVGEALRNLDAAARANAEGMPHEVILVDLHQALKALDSLTGATTTDDILGIIFSQFCIGK